MKFKSILPAIATLALLFAFLPFSPSALCADDAPQRPRILGISHAAFLCSDLDATRAFYKDYLGFAEAYSRANPDGSIRLVWIKINDLQQVELFPAKDAPAAGRLHQIAFTTDNSEGMRLYLKSKGWKVPAKPVEVNLIGTRNFTVKDPNGHTIEFVEYCGDGQILQDKGLHLPATRISPRIRHIGFAVSDYHASMRFYRDILGCVETWRGSQNGNVLNYVNLRLPDSDEYVEFILQAAPAPTAKRLGSMNHLCLEAADVDGAYAILQKRALPEKCAQPTTGPKTGKDNKRQINCFDPDGTRVEIMTPASVTGAPAPSSDAPLPFALEKTPQTSKKATPQ